MDRSVTAGQHCLYWKLTSQKTFMKKYLTKGDFLGDGYTKEKLATQYTSNKIYHLAKAKKLSPSAISSISYFTLGDAPELRALQHLQQILIDIEKKIAKENIEERELEIEDLEKDDFEILEKEFNAAIYSSAKMTIAAIDLTLTIHKEIIKLRQDLLCIRDEIAKVHKIGEKYKTQGEHDDKKIPYTPAKSTDGLLHSPT